MPFAFTNPPVDLTAIQADVTTLLGRLTAARAAALDELLAANLPSDIDNVLIGQTTINNNVLLIPTTILDCDYVDTNLGGGATLTPPDDRVLTGIASTSGVEQLQLENDSSAWVQCVTASPGGVVHAIEIDAANNRPGMMDIMACDGTAVRIRNSSGSAKDVRYFYWEWA